MPQFKLNISAVVLGFEGVVAQNGQRFDDVPVLLDLKSKMGLRMAVISRFSQTRIQEALGALFPQFDKIAERVLDGKKGEVMNKLCVDWEVSPEETIFISHRGSSIKQARLFGLRPIGLTRGENHGDPDVHALASSLVNDGASSTIISLEELRTWMRLKANDGHRL